MRTLGVIAVEDPGGALEARVRAVALARSLGFDADAVERVEAVADGMATNLSERAVGGVLHLRAAQRSLSPGLEILAVDRGPGRSDEHAADPLRGARAAADVFDVHRAAGRGTVAFARIWGARNERTLPHRALAAGAIDTTRHGRRRGAWAIEQGSSDAALVVAGLVGNSDTHGSAAALAGFRRDPFASPAETVVRILAAAEEIHLVGLAAALVSFRNGTVQVAGTGDAGILVARGETTRACSRGVHPSGYWVWEDAIEAGDTLVLHAGRVRSGWDPDLDEHHPAVVAAVLQRDGQRPADLPCVLAARHLPEAAPAA